MDIPLGTNMTNEVDIVNPPARPLAPKSSAQTLQQCTSAQSLSLSPTIATTAAPSVASNLTSTSDANLDIENAAVNAAERKLFTYHPEITYSSAFWGKCFGPRERIICGLTRDTFISVFLAIIYVLFAVIFATLLALIPQRGSGAGGGGLDVPKDTTNKPLPTTGTIISGELTFYNPAMGSCGKTHGDNDAVAAVSRIIYDAASISSNPNDNPLCWRKIRATRFRQDVGRNVTIEATVVDRCGGCAPNDLDLSPYLFQKLAPAELGRVDVTWAWI